MTERINFLTTKEMKDRIELAAKKTVKTSSDIIREALDSYFQKQDDKEILNAILKRLDSMKKEFSNLDIISSRVNVFLNMYTADIMNPEEYKKLRENVVEEMNVYMKKKGYK